MKKSQVGLISGFVFLILIGIVLWNRFVEANGESITATTTPVATTTIQATTSTIQTVTTTTIDLEKTILCEVMLEKEFCKSGTLERLPNGGSYIGFNLPPGTPIYSPRDGQTIFIFSDTDFAIAISEGDVEYSEAKNILLIVYTNDESRTVKDYIKKGEVVATVGETNFPVEEISRYNLIFLLRKDGKSGDVLDINKEFNLGLTFRSDKVQSTATSTISL